MYFPFLTWWSRFELKSSAICMVLLELFVWENTLLRKVSKGSISPHGGR